MRSRSKRLATERPGARIPRGMALTGRTVWLTEGRDATLCGSPRHANWSPRLLRTWMHNQVIQ
jgi:hypothetical protein